MLASKKVKRHNTDNVNTLEIQKCLENSKILVGLFEKMRVREQNFSA
jgi:hypothetical protein